MKNKVTFVNGETITLGSYKVSTRDGTTIIFESDKANARLVNVVLRNVLFWAEV